MSNTLPAQYQIFKGKSAARFKISHAQEDYKSGFVYVEFAPVKGKNDNGNRIYDWESSKIGIKLEIVDLAKLGYALQYGLDCQIYHEYKGTSKVIDLKRSDGGASPYFLSVTQSTDGAKSNVSVPIASEEAYALLTLFNRAIPSILGW